MAGAGIAILSPWPWSQDLAFGFSQCRWTRAGSRTTSSSGGVVSLALVKAMWKKAERFAAPDRPREYGQEPFSVNSRVSQLVSIVLGIMQMKTILRNTLAVIIGLAVGGTVNMALVVVSPHVI